MSYGAKYIDPLWGVSWASFGNSFIFIPIFVLMVFVVIVCITTKKQCKLLVHEKHASRLLLNVSWNKHYIKVLLMVGALFFLGVAFLQPQWGISDEKKHHQGRDLLIALDISRSMLAQDYQPNRLEYAKEKIKKLVKALQAERVGLLVFSGAAVMQCPLTSDHQAFFMFLDALSVETISSGTTSYSAALQKVLDSFASFAAHRSKLVLLCTDGEDFSPDISGVQAKLKAAGIHICTLGVATQDGAPIPLYDENSVQHGFQKNEKNEIVVSRRNEDVMRKLAQETGGIYVPATGDDQDIARIQSWIYKFEKTMWEEIDDQALQDVYYYCTAAAFLALLIEWVL